MERCRREMHGIPALASNARQPTHGNQRTATNALASNGTASRPRHINVGTKT